MTAFLKRKKLPHASRSISTPIPTMTRNAQNTGVTGGTSSPNSSRPCTSPSASCVRMSEAPFGNSRAKSLRFCFSLMSAKSTSGAPSRVSHSASIAAIFAGWCSSVLSPCRSPTTICSGTSTAATRAAKRSVLPAAASSAARSRRQARHHAHRERQREHLHPEAIALQPRRVARLLVAHAEVDHQPGEADGDRGEQDMEADVQPELHPGQQQRFIHPINIRWMEREYIARGWWADDTLAKWLARHVAERPDAPAVIFQDTSLTWRQLDERVRRTAYGLMALGVSRSDVVAVQLPNVPEFIVSYFAITRLGAMMCPLHMPYRGAEIETLMRHSGARLAICMPQAKDLFGGRGIAFSEIQQGEEKTVVEPGPADPFLLLYTSGTTAAPKGVVHPYRSILGNGRLGASEHQISQSSRVLCAAPLSHLYGLYSLHCAWAVGACTVLLPAFKPDDLALTVERQKPTALWTAPAHVAACRATGLFDKHDWSSLKLAIVSGSIAAPSLMREFAAKLPRCAVTQL